MKRPRPDHKSLVNLAQDAVGGESAVLCRETAPQLLKPRHHHLVRCLGILIMRDKFEHPPVKEPSFNRSYPVGFRDHAPRRADPDDAQIRLIAGHRDVNVHGMSRRPLNQLFRRIAPTHLIRRLQRRLGIGRGKRHRETRGETSGSQTSAVTKHTRNLAACGPFRKPRCAPAFLLVETTISLAILTILAILLLQLSMNILHPRQWTMMQVVSMAYMTYERAYAERIPFNDLTEDDSPWPLFPETSSVEVVMGRLPGGAPIPGTITRTRIPDANNFPVNGGAGTNVSNPAAMEVWRLQSVANYEVGGRTYLQARTVIRSQ